MNEIEKIISANPGPWEAITLPEYRPSKPYVLGISGLPGVGKSTLARAFWIKHKDTFCISGENITFAMFHTGKPTNPQYIEAYNWIYQVIDKIIQYGYAVIFDSTNTKREYRDKLRQLVGDRAPVFFVQLTADDKTLLKRLAKRPVSDDPQAIARVFPPATLRGFKAVFKTLGSDENGIIIDTEGYGLDEQLEIIGKHLSISDHQDKINNEAGETVKAGCVVVNGNKVLLVSNQDKTVYSFPKGHAEDGETAEQVALRETLEETGYKVKITRQLPDVTYNHGETGEPIRVTMFLAEPLEKVSNESEELWEWMDISKAKELIYPNLVSILNEVELINKNKIVLKIPFKGEWFVLWGGDTKELNRYHHDISNQKYAFDFVVVDKNNRTYRNEGKNNKDYYAFSKEVLTPADGVIVKVIDNIEDNIPGQMNAKVITGNVVLIKHKEDEISVLAHLKQNSIKVKIGDKVKIGQIIGLCGNSGNSTEPHLHYHLQNSEDIYSGEGIKCYFQNVRLKRNNKEELKNEYSPIQDDIINSGSK